MIQRTAQALARLVCQALLLAAVGVPLRAQQPATPFVTGPCSPADSVARRNLDHLVAAPEVPPTLKPGMMLPAFPAAVQRAGYGKVVAAFVVDKHGRVNRTTVTVLSSTDSVLSRWACKVAPSIRFNPARDHGHAVATEAALPFIYHGPAAQDST